MSIAVYVAAPYADAPAVREVHGRMLALGSLRPTSSWAMRATGPERLESLSIDEIASAIECNDRDLFDSDAMLVLARSNVGGEMFAEVARALAAAIPIVWVGRRILSTFRPGVFVVDDLDEALEVLMRYAEGD